MGLTLLFCCEIKKKLRVLLYTSFLLTVINAVSATLFVNLIFGGSFLLLILLHILVICYTERGITKNEPKALKLSLIGALSVTILHVGNTFLIWLLSQSKWSWSWASNTNQLFWFIPAFTEFLIITLIVYSDYFIWQLWKQISFNGDLERSPPDLALPSISWTVEEHQAQCNAGYEEEDVPVVKDPHLYDGVYAGDDEHKITTREGNSKFLSEKRNSELLAEFECPVCYNLLAPPLQILQCSAGHVVCSACKDQGIESCPTCRNKIIGRAHHMENIATLFFDDLK